jgi:hypothetical protein
MKEFVQDQEMMSQDVSRSCAKKGSPETALS